jgi:hypothetical protein
LGEFVFNCTAGAASLEVLVMVDPALAVVR